MKIEFQYLHKIKRNKLELLEHSLINLAVKCYNTTRTLDSFERKLVTEFDKKGRQVNTDVEVKRLTTFENGVTIICLISKRTAEITITL